MNDTSDRFEPLPPAFYRRPAAEVARALLGRYLVRDLPAGGDQPARRLALRLVETEAYQGEGDAASHARSGPRTPRARRLYRDGGHAYVYLIYGMHHCANATTGTAEDGTAVLLRAGAPIAELPGATPEEAAAALAEMHARRRLARRPRPPRPGELAGGPGRLCQALGIDRSFDGRPLWEGELRIVRGEPVPEAAVARGPRIGVDYAGEAAAWPLRFAIAGHPEMSRPRLG